MCYAFSQLPLLDRDAFPPARDEKIAALVLDLEKRAKAEHDYDSVTYKAATILAWYHRGSLTDEDLAKRINEAFAHSHDTSARVMLSTLGDAGRSVLASWDAAHITEAPST